MFKLLEVRRIIHRMFWLLKRPWGYLQTTELDKRFKIISKYVDVADKTILDIDAGTCRFVNYIPPTWKSYIANDIHPEYKPNNKRIEYHMCDDTKVPEVIKGRQIDILALFGYGAGHIKKNKYESRTLKDVVYNIVGTHKPELIILESAHDYNSKYGMLDEIVVDIGDTYSISAHEIIDSTMTENIYAKREFYVLKRKL